jgi:hypothetical protein
MEHLSERLASHCATQTNGASLWINPLALFVRNVLFMLIVLTHGFRRLLPPY